MDYWCLFLKIFAWTFRRTRNSVILHSVNSNSYEVDATKEENDHHALQNYDLFIILDRNMKFNNIIDVKFQKKGIQTWEMQKKVSIESSWASEHIQSKYHEESKSVQFTPPIWKIKLSRKHLSMNQKEWITNLFTIHNKSISEISKELFLSYSTVWRILREGKYNEVKRNCKNSSFRGSCKLDLYAKKSITDYVQNTYNSFCLKDIQHYLLTERDIEAKIIDISSFIKNKLHLSYKRCSSRPSQKDIARFMHWSSQILLTTQKF